eukprot:1595469-Amphidinium_carterae.2
MWPSIDDDDLPDFDGDREVPEEAPIEAQSVKGEHTSESASVAQASLPGEPQDLDGDREVLHEAHTVAQPAEGEHVTEPASVAPAIVPGATQSQSMEPVPSSEQGQAQVGAPTAPADEAATHAAHTEGTTPLQHDAADVCCGGRWVDCWAASIQWLHCLVL